MTNHNSSYFAEIGGDFKGIQGDISGGVINQYIITEKSSIKIKNQRLITGSPYLGLRKFEVDDKDKFFGRDRWIIELTNYLEENNILLLLGASGSGKSSLIQAGLIPALKDRLGSNQLVNLTFVPDVNPFESFYACLLANRYTQSQAKPAQIVKENTLLEVVQALKNDAQWLIFIDQFEEVFTRTPKTEQSIFIKSLIKLIDKNDNSVKVIMTMRADFLDKLSPYPDLGKVHDSSSRMLTDMEDSDLRLAIAEPAARNGVIFEKGLIDTIIANFHQQAGSLPLLQYTLNLLWTKDDIQDRVLNTKTYQELGGVNGALQQQANKIYDKFDETQQKLAKEIFLKLISLEGKEAVSRRADKAIFERDEIQKGVLDQLIDNRLLVSKGEDGKATVEVAHEALIRSWKVLQDLIQENKEIIILTNRLDIDAQQWYNVRQQNPQKAISELWNGSKLERIVELRKEQSLPNLDAVAIKFIEASVEEKNRLIKAEEERIKRELKATQLTTRLAIATAIGAIGALIAVSFSFLQQQQFQKTIEVVFLEINDNETLNALPNLLKKAEDLKRSVDTISDTASSQTLMNHYQQYEDEFTKLVAYYRKILAVAQGVQEKFEYDLNLIKAQLFNNQDSETDKPLTNEQKVKLQQEESKLNKKIHSASEIEKEADTSLTSLSKKYPITESKAEKILEKLKEANIGYSVNKNELIGWIENSNRQYYNVSIESLNLLQDERLKNDAPDIDVIYYYYQQLLGGKELPENPQIDQGKLKEAIRRAYNNKNGTDFQSFEEIVVNVRLPKN
jgi:energy-coupling factor transporter ATP-binding protein EcfA2